MSLSSQFQILTLTIANKNFLYHFLPFCKYLFFIILSNFTGSAIFVKVECQNFRSSKCLFFSLDSVYWRRERKTNRTWRTRKDKNHGWELPKRIRKKIKTRRRMGYNGRGMRPEKVIWWKKERTSWGKKKKNRKGEGRISTRSESKHLRDK